MRSLSKLMDDAVREQGGVVQSFTGDGIMAVFGAPVAFEDAPVRACRAALSILDRLKAAAPDLRATHGVQPQLRIGLNTGQAVVGKVQGGADAGVTVLGDTVNFAARLQSLAEPDSVVMRTQRTDWCRDRVEMSLAGERNVKGKSAPGHRPAFVADHASSRNMETTQEPLSPTRGAHPSAAPGAGIRPPEGQLSNRP